MGAVAAAVSGTECSARGSWPSGQLAMPAESRVHACPAGRLGAAGLDVRCVCGSSVLPLWAALPPPCQGAATPDAPSHSCLESHPLGTLLGSAWRTVLLQGADLAPAHGRTRARSLGHLLGALLTPCREVSESGHCFFPHFQYRLLVSKPWGCFCRAFIALVPETAHPDPYHPALGGARGPPGPRLHN